MSPPSLPDRCHVSITRSAGGGAEVHKRATTPGRRDRLVREAATLRRARHPGVVELVELRDEPDGTAVLVTRLAGTHTLATWSRPSLDEIAGVLVVLAETLADLHHLGLAHGAVEADHVVLDGLGRPVLCGFDRSGDPRPGDDVAALGRLTRLLLEVDDPTVDDDRVRRRSGRRQATARRRLLDLADQASDPDARARPGARRFAAAVLTAVPTASLADPPAGARRAPVERPARAADPILATVPDLGPDLGPLADPEPGTDTRPAAPDGDVAVHHGPGPAAAADGDHDVEIDHDDGSDADRVHDAVVGSGRDTRPDDDRVQDGNHGHGHRHERTGAGDDHGPTGVPSSGPAPHRRGAASEVAPGRVSRGALTALTVVGVACLVFGALSAWTGARPELGAATIARPAPTRPPGSVSAPTTVAPPVPSSAVVDAGNPTSVLDVACPAAAGCSTVRSGGVIDHAGSRFGLGDPTDELVLADPRCPDPPAVALLRPSDGVVFLFDRWAEPDHDVAPRPGGTVLPGSHWAPRPLDARGCAPLAVLDPGGAVHPLAPPTGETEPAPEPQPRQETEPEPADPIGAAP